jgi:hypothetical protein
MTLKEKFDKISCSDCDMPYCDIKCTILKPSELNHLEQIADEFAIGFAEWFLNLSKSDDWEKFDYNTNEKLLEIYKKEKGL